MTLIAQRTAPQNDGLPRDYRRVRLIEVPKIDVLDDGFVEFVDVMGSDDTICRDARVSTGSDWGSDAENERLIRYLIRNRHDSPFEQAELKFRVRAPMDVWRQWIRTRTANVVEYSTRYSEAIDAARTTAPNAWRRQAASTRQGSDGFLDEETGAELSKDEAVLQRMARDVYKRRLGLGVAREQARKDLPLSTYTEAVWKIDLRNLLRFLELRLDDAAQFEIREYAKAVASITRELFPKTYRAFADYRLNATTLTRFETDALRDLLAKKGVAFGRGEFDERFAELESESERTEALAKFRRLGLVAD